MPVSWYGSLHRIILDKKFYHFQKFQNKKPNFNNILSYNSRQDRTFSQGINDLIETLRIDRSSKFKNPDLAGCMFETYISSCIW